MSLQNKRTKAGRAKWLRVTDLPFSKAFVYRLLAEGLIDSVMVRQPGRRKGVRLIDADSLDRYLLSQGGQDFKESRYLSTENK
jgi:hypothetical protein